MRVNFSAPVLEIKEISETGIFSGYGAVFGNKDFGGDILAPDAFAATLAEHQKTGTRPRMFWQHDQSQPIGKWTEMAVDNTGLVLEGKLNMGVQRAQEAYALLKEGDIDGLSIGYATLDSDFDSVRQARILKSVSLMEVSVVSMPMNARARIGSVKSLDDFADRLRAGDVPSIKEFEEILRDAGFPKSMATRIASVGYVKAIRSESEGSKANDAAAFLKALRG